MRLLFLGDLVGRSGRQAALDRLPGLRRDLRLDLVVVNGENAAGGFGITEAIAKELFEAGADVITGGNHSWDQREILGAMDRLPRLLRPLNFPPGTPGRGTCLVELPRGKKALVVNAMGRLFMDPLDDPFRMIEQELAKVRLGRTVDAIVVDIHAEATSEKMALGHALDGRVTLVVGTHTHVPTADTMILPGGTAYQSDAGMCGDYDSVIGMDKRVPIERFTRKLPTERLTAAQGEATVCGLLVETEPGSGLAAGVWPLRLGGRLEERMPPSAS